VCSVPQAPLNSIVDDEDIPDSARLPPNEEGEEGEEGAELSPVKKKVTPRKKKADDGGNGEVKEAKPQKVSY